MVNSVRSSNFELLRIFCMLSVVGVHYAWHGGSTTTGNNIELAYFLGNFAQIGVACFVLIGSWFLVDKAFCIKRIFNLWKQVVFYSFGISLLLIIVSPQHISIKELIKSIMPVVFQRYWFVTPYIILLFLHPILNYILNICSRQQIRWLVLALFIGLSVIPCFWIIDYNPLAIKTVRFIMYYIIAYALKRKYINIGWNNNKLNFLVAMSVAMIMYGISLFSLQIHQTEFASYYPKGGQVYR